MQNPTQPRFVTHTDFPEERPNEVYIGDTVTGEFRPVNAFVAGDAPAGIRDREILAGEIVARMNEHRAYLPELWCLDRKCFVYADGSPA